MFTKISLRTVTLSRWLPILLFAAMCRADNPIIQTKFTADPAPMVYHNTVYLYTSDARVASAAAGGTIQLRLDSPTGPLVGACAVPGTGGWQTWTTQSCKVVGTTGVHDLYLRFIGGSGHLFNFDWWQFH